MVKVRHHMKPKTETGPKLLTCSYRLENLFIITTPIPYEGLDGKKDIY
jgi:hypothetical protein